MIGSPRQTEPCHFVHVWDARRLKRSLATERRLRFVGSTIGNDESVFHESRREVTAVGVHSENNAAFAAFAL